MIERTCLSVLFACVLLSAQALHFEVASLKPSAPGKNFGGIRPAAGGQRYQATNCPLQLMLQVAFRVKAEQIQGGPAWVQTEPFDMDAKAERPSSTEELHAMLIDLLTERFHLRYHKEKKEMPVYALVVDKGGVKMTRHEAANAGEPWIDTNISGMVRVKLKAISAPMDYVAFRLAQMLDRPVVDLTGLRGGYDFTLDYTRELPPGVPENALLNGAPIDTSGPTIFAAARQQLGLELKAQKGFADVIVIDHVEKPSEN